MKLLGQGRTGFKSIYFRTGKIRSTKTKEMARSGLNVCFIALFITPQRIPGVFNRGPRYAV